ncbi:MAG TPA: AzlD domain-containing protein [Xanthobacteraceae bacterium]|nr:AzlD domain-containing protein [Xanthobacteraceae bacterium]
MSATLRDLNPYLVLVLIGFLPNEIWRWMGVFVARGIDEKSEFLIWVRAVATAILAGVIAQLIFVPAGSLGTIPLWARLGALGVGFVVFLVFRRSLIAGVVAGEATLIAAGMAFGMAR